MKILSLCNKSPYPPKEGGPIAMNMIIEGLTDAGHDVKVLAINTNKYSVDVNQIPKEYKRKTRIETVYIDLSVKAIPAFLNLFTNKSYHVQRFISKDFNEKLIEILKNEHFDIIQLETLFITPYIETIRQYSDAKIILRSHNIEHLIWERIAKKTKNPIKKFYISHLSRTLKAYEINAIKKYDGLACITKKDAEYFKKLHSGVPVTDISFGIHPDKFKRSDDNFEFPSLCHIGAMNWIPNIEGIKWFLDNVWENVHIRFPQLKFYLAGREMPDWLTHSNYPNVVVVGEVEDAQKFIHSKAIMIVPLLSGSGIRIKIIEGMASGKAIISTTIGAEGINYTHGENILIANREDEFIDAIASAIQSIEDVKRIGKNAHQLVVKNHNTKKIIEDLLRFYKEIL